MPTRETHARIYQGEIDQSDYRELESVARGEGISPRTFILKEIIRYLKNWDLNCALDIEEVALNDGRTRFYLWIPYEKSAELEHLMKTRGTTHIQELTRKAIRQRNQEIR
ncbi:MAG: hypothetical protein JRL30_26680 [Deltaproteobacteria bacterium]|nr:hypothetical protein [Deltaproteobacteria bacterium]